MKNYLLGVITVLMIGVLCSATNIQDILTIKPAIPKSVVCIIYGYMHTEEEINNIYAQVKKGYIVKCIAPSSTNNLGFVVMEKY